MTDTTRAEHLEFCKQRALAYLPTDPQGAMASMISDLRAHPLTADSATTIGPLMLRLFMLPGNATGSLQNPHEMERFIHGFN